MTFTKNYIDFDGSVYTFENIEKLPDTKENALLQFIGMTCKSWTFNRMTQAEKEKCIDALYFPNEQGMLKGTFRQRWDILNAVYNAYLSGLGYVGGNWRE